MAFDFGAFLSSVGQVAPAMSEGAEIRRQRAADAAQVSQQAQAASDTHQARLAQLEREKALTSMEQQQIRLQQNKLTPLGDPVYNAKDKKYYRVFLTADGQLKNMPIEGYDPQAEKEQNLRNANKLIEDYHLDPKSELAEQIRAQALGVKLPLSALPRQIVSPDGTVYVSDPRHPENPAVPVTGPNGQPFKKAMPVSSQGSETTSQRYDPISGTTSTTTSIRRPLGAAGVGAPVGGGQRGGEVPATGGTPSPGLDENGLIPASAIGTSLGRGLSVTEPVRQAANVLLSNPLASDQDLEARLRSPSRALAMRYGWQPHLKLSTSERGEVQTDQRLVEFSNEVLPIIERNGLQNANAPEDSARGIRALAEYNAGRVPSDPVYADIYKSVAAIGIAGAAPWVRIGRNKYTFEVIQKHLPQPWQTPARIYTNTKWLRDNVVPSSEKSILGRVLPQSAQDIVKKFAGQNQPPEPAPEVWVRDAKGQLVQQK